MVRRAGAERGLLIAQNMVKHDNKLEGNPPKVRSKHTNSLKGVASWDSRLTPTPIALRFSSCRNLAMNTEKNRTFKTSCAGMYTTLARFSMSAMAGQLIDICTGGRVNPAVGEVLVLILQSVDGSTHVMVTARSAPTISGSTTFHATWRGTRSRSEIGVSARTTVLARIYRVDCNACAKETNVETISPLNTLMLRHVARASLCKINFDQVLRTPGVPIRFPVKALPPAGGRVTSTIGTRSRFVMSASSSSLGRVGILWRGNADDRLTATPATSRFSAVFAALAEAGVDAEPVVYEDDVADAVRSQLLALDGVLVWVNPIHEGRNRAKLDALLREVASLGPWVSTHPDVTLKMGTKEVLYNTRSLTWGCADTARYDSLEAMRGELPARLASGPRVVKRNRGNGGQGVWKVEALPSMSTPPDTAPSSSSIDSDQDRPIVRVLDATGETPDVLPLDEFLSRISDYFRDYGSCVIDQPFQPRLTDGVVRCYMAGDRCAGFGHQKVKALVESPVDRAESGPRLYSSNLDPRFQRLRRLMEEEWTPQLCSVLQVSPRDLPMIWDADFMLGPRDPGTGDDSYVLGEINVSSVFPIPDEAPAEIATRVADRLRAARL
eukprot:jgi/Mesvir1/3518/Mv11994-RA.1